MFSLLSNLANNVFSIRGSGCSEESVGAEIPVVVSSHCDNDKPTLEKEIEKMLMEIGDIRAEAIDGQPEPQLNLVSEQDDVGCFYAYGTVSRVSVNFILIDNRYMCEMKYVVPTGLEKGHRVVYMGYRTSKGEELKVRKILYKAGSEWEPPLKMQLDETDSDWHENATESLTRETSLEVDVELMQSLSEDTRCVPLQPDFKRQICSRVHIGKVERRNGRELHLEDKTVIDLDKVKAKFVPVVGDWLALDCWFESNENIPNFQGEILEIKEIRPHKIFNKLGKITEYNENAQYGVVDKIIVFNKRACQDGYLPCVGDKVVVQSIESDQMMQIHWRALNVVPMEEAPNKYEISAVKFEPQWSPDELQELLADKRNIEITCDTSITLNIEEEKIIKVKIRNNGNFNQTFKKCVFLSRKVRSRLSLVMSQNKNLITIQPEQEFTYSFKCIARFVGPSKEFVVFHFKDFSIARIFEITVKSIKPCILPQYENLCSPYNTGQNSQSLIPQEYEDGTYIKGIKPYKPAKFIAKRPVTWKIPPILWSTIEIIMQDKKTRSESEFALQEKVPCLNQALCFGNYKQRFDYLLYLEEIACIINMKKFKMDSAVLHRSQEYLSLNVPGLAERRPSLIIGDRVIVRFKWSKDSKYYEGYIHKIKSSDVFLKFHSNFHESYNGEDCQVEFKSSTTVLQRSHTAIGAVINNLGQDILFPTRVHLKKPQYNFVEEGEEAEENEQPKLSELTNAEERLKLVESIVYKRNLKWFNKKLNIYQKNAVKNILKGLARPLPYVIFGPPGTGKTVTVVEAILQIYFTISESSILIATPSNSSANLIAERLLDAKILLPGDLVRLVAHHYLESSAIPEQLIPYCMTGDIAEEGTRSGVNQADPRGYQTQVTMRTICRHRIIIGTCAALGVLYNMGCKIGHFTHIFVDEAGQASEPEIMIPLSLAHKNSTQVVLAGDPKQLGPVNQSRLAGYFGLNDSFLVRLLQQFPYQKDPEGFEAGFDPRLITKLLINYRSLPDLLALPNKLFYDSELIPQVDPKYSKEAELLEHLQDVLPKRLGAPPPVVFHCVYGTNMQDPDSPSWYNQEEATQVYIYLLMLYNHGLQPDDIGIITPYAKQVFHIKHLLAHMELESPKIGSVEEFQGQERKVILLSTVRTSEAKIEDDVRHSLGFVAARERLNVAISRARALLIIVGHPKLLQQDVYWRNVLEYCSAQNSVVDRDS
ncbi:probable RNA helicase armi [Copidosoma floridanum]|uniref:probable RNA helicase armi n=1 Tax=Copidosoma floridanum TaxID=29053 RepID=UPI0006C97625|nr:probable RNA helicase armi [Copidosoma floridanum]